MDIKDAALKFLASRARTSGEMKKHLLEKDFQEQEIEKTLRMLKDLRYLDDLDYCSQYLEYAFRKGKGILRIKRELEEKGVDRENIEIALDDYESDETELERAEQQAAKIAAGSSIDKRLIGRIGRRLTSQGYSSDVVYQVLGKYMRGLDE